MTVLRTEDDTPRGFVTMAEYRRLQERYDALKEKYALLRDSRPRHPVVRGETYAVVTPEQRAAGHNAKGAYRRGEVSIGDRIVAVLLAAGEPMTAAQLAEAIGADRFTVNARMCGLEGEGRIRRDCRKRAADTGRTSIHWTIGAKP